VCLYVSVQVNVPYPFLFALKPSVANEPGLFMHPYTAGVDYTKEANILSNDEYATAPFHPSGKIIGSFGVSDASKVEADDIRMAEYIREDAAYNKEALYQAMGVQFAATPGSYPGKSQDYPAMSLIAMADTLPYEQTLAGTGHHWKWASCEWLRHCDAATEYPGSYCQTTMRATTVSGYCYTSDTGSLECGRLIESTDKYNGITQETTYRSRCPRGTPTQSTGITVSKRLLTGGCMIADDHNFTASAEVHVPQLCYLPKDYGKGCMFPGATNYAPSAVQPGACIYQTLGCTSQSAVNYNAYATNNDGSCIEEVKGCTVQSTTTSYTGVDSNTPSYQQRYVGVNARSIGHVILPSYRAVLQYDSGANVNYGCVVAIEGCMDPTAINYDSHANINTNTWCIPRVEGCMMPNYHAVTRSTYDGSGAKLHPHDGGSSNFDASATVHIASDCVIERLGCTDSLASNFDEHATVNQGCYASVGGCFDDAAINYNCTGLGYDGADGNYVWYTETCSTLLAAAGVAGRATYHDPNMCLYSAVEQVVGFDGDAEFMYTKLTVAGDIGLYGTVELLKIAQAFDTAITGGTTLTKGLAEGGSVLLTLETPLESTGQYNEWSSKVKSDMNSIAKVNAALGVDALSLPIVTASGKPSSNDDAALIGGAVGGTLGGLLLLGIIFVLVKRKGKKVEA
jgi:hypothetical protein